MVSVAWLALASCAFWSRFACRYSLEMQGHYVGQSSSIQLGCAHLGTVRHVCAFFGGEEEAYRVLLPFIADGFSSGHKAVHVVRPERETVHLRRLSSSGIDVAAARVAGQLDVRHDTDTYLVDGRFDCDRMLAAFEAMASGNDNGGFPLSRIVCDMDWATDHLPDFDALIEFEARVNEVWSRHDDVVVCIYDVRKLRGDMVIDIMRTHPVVLIGDVLQENPFYVPPARYLRERAGRMNGGGSSS